MGGAGGCSISGSPGRGNEEWVAGMDPRLEGFGSATVTFFFPILGNGHPIGNSLRASKHWTKQSIPKVIQTQQTDPRY
jgi:hypothetical protein